MTDPTIRQRYKIAAFGFMSSLSFTDLAAAALESEKEMLIYDLVARRCGQWADAMIAEDLEFEAKRKEL